MPSTQPPLHRSVTDELHALQDAAAGRPVTIADALAHFRERGPAAVMLLLTLPCMVPGLSAALQVPVGLGVAVYGLGLVLLRPAWVPGILTRRTLSPDALRRVVSLADRWLRPVERLLRRRMAFMQTPGGDVAVGLALAFLGVFLAAPLFLPGSNELPAAVIVLLLLGLIERDGVVVLVGLVLTLAVGIASVYVAAFVARHGLHGAAKVLHHHAATSRSSTLPATLP